MESFRNFVDKLQYEGLPAFPIDNSHMDDGFITDFF